MAQYKVLLLFVCLYFSHAVKAIETDVLTTLAYFQLDPTNSSTSQPYHEDHKKSSVYVIAQASRFGPNQNAGIGYNYQLNSQFAVNTSLSYQNDQVQANDKISLSPVEFTNDAILVETGTQFRISPVVKFYSALVYRMPKESQSSDIGFKLASDYYFNRHVSAGMHAQMIAENKILGVHGSFHF